MSYILPTITVLDDFFDDPLWVRNYALGLPYLTDTNHEWPGERTAKLDVFNKDLLGYTVNKFLSLYYDLKLTPVIWHANGSFQRVSSIYKDGWIHTDAELMTLIIFLNEEVDSSSGTTLYEKKTELALPLHNDKKKESYENTSLIDSIEQYRKENNAQFEESIIIKNKFNRLIAFDSNKYHGANNFSNTESRLTLTLFIDKLTVNSYPIQRMKQI